MSIASVLYVMESSDEVFNFQLIDAPLRYSQIIFPIGCLILVFLLLSDFRLPPLFGYTFLFYSIFWLLPNLVLGNMMMQMMLGLVNDVGAMLAYGGLALWFMHLAWGCFTTHPDDNEAAPTQEPLLESER